MTSDCHVTTARVDTDIQNDKESLTVYPTNTRIRAHILYYGKKGWPVRFLNEPFTDDDWKREEVRIHPKQKVEGFDGLMYYDIGHYTVIVPDTFPIDGEVVNTVQPFRFKKYINSKLEYSLS